MDFPAPVIPWLCNVLNIEVVDEDEEDTKTLMMIIKWCGFFTWRHGSCHSRFDCFCMNIHILRDHPDHIQCFMFVFLTVEIYIFVSCAVASNIPIFMARKPSIPTFIIFPSRPMDLNLTCLEKQSVREIGGLLIPCLTGTEKCSV